MGWPKKFEYVLLFFLIMMTVMTVLNLLSDNSFSFNEVEIINIIIIKMVTSFFFFVNWDVINIGLYKKKGIDKGIICCREKKNIFLFMTSFSHIIKNYFLQVNK